MPEPVYKYDSKTLRYIRTSVRWDRLLLRGLGLGVFTSLFVVLFIQVYLTYFQADEQRVIASENFAFAANRIPVSNEIAELEKEIIELEKSEADVHRKLYFIEQNGSPDDIKFTSTDLSLDFDQSEFERIYQRTFSLAGLGTKRATSLNLAYSFLFWPSKNDIKDLQSYPTLAPIHQISSDIIACGFGNQINPFNKKNYLHPGLDILTETGTPIVAAADGLVREVQIDQSPGGEGTYLLIDHGNGYQTKYSQLAEIMISRGQIVRQGQAIAKAGKTGSSIAPHLHYEVLVKGRPVDPIPYLLEQLTVGELDAIRKISAEKRQSLD